MVPSNNVVGLKRFTSAGQVRPLADKGDVARKRSLDRQTANAGDLDEVGWIGCEIGGYVPGGKP